MNKRSFLWVCCLLAAASLTSRAATITVTTVNNVNPPAGQTSLLQAMTQAQAGDTINFNISGTGTHYIETPVGGYPLITKNNITINGYSQPGSSPNTNPILAPNNAKITIILDSRNGNHRLLDYSGTNPNDDTGYGDTEAAIIGVLEAKGVVISGLCLLGQPIVGPNDNGDDIGLYGVSFAKGASGRISGCWIGVDVDGKTIASPANGVTGFRYRVRDESNQVTESIYVSDVVLGVQAGSTNASAEFNVITGAPAIPVIIEGAGTRISGNFIEVFPDGVTDYNPAFDPVLAGNFEGHIEIGRQGNDTVIGTDGDGVNDSNERNVFGGVVSPSLGGYDHAIEFYGQSPGTNIVVAGNYFGLGVDGVTRFTNGVPALNAAGGAAQYRFGSDFDGVSDNVEGNVVYNNWPPELIFPTGFEHFFDELSVGSVLSARGNVMVNNDPFPVGPFKLSGADFFLDAYYSGALVDTTAGVKPTLSTNTSLTRLIGTVPIANTNYPTTIIDLYAADPEGILNGQALGLIEMPNGFVQGKTYLASFVEGSAADLNPKPGEFEFDISKVELKGSKLTVTANYSKSPAGTHNAITLTSPFAEPVEVTFTPGSVESVGLRHIVKDTPVINPGIPSLGNWEPYASVLGTSTFLVEANTFADGSDSFQRFVVALQPAAGGTMKLGEGFYADNGTPFKGQINASRQNGNPGRVAGDQRPGAVNFMVGGEASPYLYPEFQSDNRWNLGFDRLADGRFATVQSYKLDTTTLVQTPLMKAQDSANGRLTTGAPLGSEITRFGGDLVCLDNGNFVSMVDDRSRVRNPDGSCSVVTIFAPDGTVVKESFKVANGDIWSNLAAYKGGFAVRAVGVLYFFDNSGNLKGQVDQNSSGAAFDRGRGDGTRIAGHINSPYVYLAGKVSGENFVKVAVWDSRDQSFLALTDASEGAFTGGFDRANLAVDALNRIIVSWVSQPEGYEAQQVAARVLAFNGSTKTFTALTKSFLPFVNQGKTAGIHSYQMSVATTTKQILVAAKGEISLTNDPESGADSPQQINFFTVISHPDPQDDPTLPAGAVSQPKLNVATSGNNITLTWAGSGFDLQSAPTVIGPWAKVTTTGNTYTTAMTGTVFFRLRNQ